MGVDEDNWWGGELHQAHHECTVGLSPAQGQFGVRGKTFATQKGGPCISRSACLRRPEATNRGQKPGVPAVTGHCYQRVGAGTAWWVGWVTGGGGGQ